LSRWSWRSGRRPWGRRLTARDQRDRGATTLQFVIIVPVVFALVFGCIQVSIYSFARTLALTAAQEAVSAQRAYQAPAGTGEARAWTVIRSQSDTLRNVQVTVRVVGRNIVATVTGITQSVLPGINGYQVKATASGPIEEFRS